jgi:hypothetical protein
LLLAHPAPPTTAEVAIWRMSLRQFQILASIAIAGDARRSELLAGPLREVEASNFDYRVDGLVRHGLLQRRTVRVPGGPPQTVLCVTLAGRTAIDRVVTFVGQVAAELPAASVAVEGSPAPQSRAQRRPERPATDTEALRLLFAMTATRGR